jgi:biopolymer transport protein ExbB/TolQ
MNLQNSDIFEKKNSYIGIRYLKSGREMVNNWVLLMVVFFLVPSLVFISYVWDMAINGGFLFLATFFLVFAYCAKENFKLIHRIACESDILKNHFRHLRPNTDFGEDNGSMLASHVNNLNLIWKRSGKKHSKQDSLVEILHAKLKNEGSVAVIASNIMITLGLIGTISGLISSIGGLNVGEDSGDLMKGVGAAIDGMGVAFYTTLIGSMFGGITLRMLHFYVDKQVDAYIFTMAEAVEVKIIPSLRMNERKTDIRDIAVATVSALRDMNILKENNYEVNEICIAS